MWHLFDRPRLHFRPPFHHTPSNLPLPPRDLLWSFAGFGSGYSQTFCKWTWRRRSRNVSTCHQNWLGRHNMQELPNQWEGITISSEGTVEYSLMVVVERRLLSRPLMMPQRNISQTQALFLQQQQQQLCETFISWLYLVLVPNMNRISKH